jgi:hypothetical protein
MERMEDYQLGLFVGERQDEKISAVNSEEL